MPDLLHFGGLWLARAQRHADQAFADAQCDQGGGGTGGCVDQGADAAGLDRRPENDEGGGLAVDAPAATLATDPVRPSPLAAGCLRQDRRPPASLEAARPPGRSRSAPSKDWRENLKEGVGDGGGGTGSPQLSIEFGQFHGHVTLGRVGLPWDRLGDAFRGGAGTEDRLPLFVGQGDSARLVARL